MNDLLGKYAIFVVPAYVLTVAVFLGLAAYTTYRMLHWQKLADGDAKKPEKK
jgi:heme exporter protein D